MINGALCYPSRPYCTSVLKLSPGQQASCVHEGVSVCLCMYLCFHCVHVTVCTCAPVCCVCVCTSVCTCVPVCIVHVSVHVCVPVPTCVPVCASVCPCVHVCTLWHLRVHFVCLCVPVCTSVCIHMYLHLVCVHISACACVCVSMVKEENCCKDSSGGVPRRGCRLCSESHIFHGRWSHPKCRPRLKTKLFLELPTVWLERLCEGLNSLGENKKEMKYTWWGEKRPSTHPPSGLLTHLRDHSRRTVSCYTS